MLRIKCTQIQMPLLQLLSKARPYVANSIYKLYKLFLIGMPTLKVVVDLIQNHLLRLSLLLLVFSLVNPFIKYYVHIIQNNLNNGKFIINKLLNSIKLYLNVNEVNNVI